MIFFCILNILPFVLTIIKDRKDYFEWRKKYETKRTYNYSNSL